MIRSLLPFALLLIAATEPARFEPQPERFASAGACQAHLETLAGVARGQDYVAVQGPYAIGPGDVRIHMIRAEGNGHRITEHRCLDAALSARSWRHAMEDDDKPATIESLARDAEWLKKSRPQQ